MAWLYDHVEPELLKIGGNSMCVADYGSSLLLQYYSMAVRHSRICGLFQNSPAATKRTTRETYRGVSRI